jgi:hypothetical protein
MKTPKPKLPKIEFDREVDGRHIAEIPSSPGCFVYGRTKAEARRKVLELHVMITKAQITKS